MFLQPPFVGDPFVRGPSPSSYHAPMMDNHAHRPPPLMERFVAFLNVHQIQLVHTVSALYTVANCYQLVDCTIFRQCLSTVVNDAIVTDATVQQPGFDLSCCVWFLLNRFSTDQGRCLALKIDCLWMRTTAHHKPRGRCVAFDIHILASIHDQCKTALNTCTDLSQTPAHLVIPLQWGHRATVYSALVLNAPTHRQMASLS